MPLIPYAYRPSVMVRSRALRRGVFGGSPLWRVVAVFVFGRTTFKKIFGKQEQVLDKAVLKGGRLMQVETIPPRTRRDRRRARAAARQ